LLSVFPNPLFRVRAYRMAKFPVLLKAIPLAKNLAPRSIFDTHTG